MKIQTTRRKRKQSQFLPVMGLLIAICVGVIAYFGASPAVELVKDQVDAETRARMVADQAMLEYAFMVLIWLVVFSVLMLVVAAALGEDPEKEERLLKPPPNATAKELKQYYKKLDALEKKRLKRAKEMQRKRERE